MGTSAESRVYFIEDEAAGLIKVGFSVNVRKRLRELAASIGRTLTLQAAS